MPKILAPCRVAFFMIFASCFDSASAQQTSLSTQVFADGNNNGSTAVTRDALSTSNNATVSVANPTTLAVQLYVGGSQVCVPGVLTGLSAASANTYAGGLQATLSGSGQYSSIGPCGIYGVSNTGAANHQWTDTLTFTGSGSVTLTFLVSGTMSLASNVASYGSGGDSLSINASFPTGYNPTSYAWTFEDRYPTTTSGAGLTAVNGAFSQSFQVTTNFNSANSTQQFSLTGQGSAANGSANYAVTLSSVTFGPGTTPGATMTNASGQLSYANTAISGDVPLPSWALALLSLGVVAAMWYPQSRQFRGGRSKS